MFIQNENLVQGFKINLCRYLHHCLFSDCECSSDVTSFDNLCEHYSGNCTCKDVFTGTLCDLCPPMTIGIPPNCESKLYTACPREIVARGGHCLC